MADELEELIGFLSSPLPHVRHAAADIARGLTGDPTGLAALSARADAALPALFRLLFASASAAAGVRLSEGEVSGDASAAAAACDALINLTQDGDVAGKLVAMRAVDEVMRLLYALGVDVGRLPRLLVMLLANLTQVDSGVDAILQVSDDKMRGLYISKLVRSFCRSTTATTEDQDTFGHVSSILVNISKVEAGRRILLDPKRSLLKQIIGQFDSTSQLRKRGVVGTIRNCCFDADNQIDNLLSISEYLWPALVLPVAGNKIYSEQDRGSMPSEIGNALSHEREPVDDPEIRRQALEAIYMILLQDSGMKAFWAVNGPRILQVGYEDEEDPKVMEAYELIGSMLVSNNEANEQQEVKMST